MTKAKYRLHATKVDRIAIVDRPAVPDAQIVLFKRQGSNGEVIDRPEDTAAKVNTAWSAMKTLHKALDFASEFVIQSTDGAVTALENAFWSTLFDDQVEADAKRKAFDGMFGEFADAVTSIVAGNKRAVEKQASSPTPEEVEQSFQNSMRMAAIQDAFSIFRSHLGFFVMNSTQIEDAKAIITRIVEAFKTFVLTQADLVVAKKLKVDAEVVLSKEGRIISTARLNRLKQALEVLTQIIAEADKPKNKQEGNQMTLEELNAAIVALKAQVEELKKALAGANAEALTGLTTRLDAVETAIKNMTSIAPTAEVAEAQRLAVENAILNAGKAEKATEELEKRVKAVEGTTAQIVKGFDTISKRMGQRNSLTDDPAGAGAPAGGDPFEKAVRGIGAPKKLQGT